MANSFDYPTFAYGHSDLSLKLTVDIPTWLVIATVNRCLNRCKL